MFLQPLVPLLVLLFLRDVSCQTTATEVSTVTDTTLALEPTTTLPPTTTTPPPPPLLTTPPTPWQFRPSSPASSSASTSPSTIPTPTTVAPPGDLCCILLLLPTLLQLLLPIITPATTMRPPTTSSTSTQVPRVPRPTNHHPQTPFYGIPLYGGFNHYHYGAYYPTDIFHYGYYNDFEGNYFGFDTFSPFRKGKSKMTTTNRHKQNYRLSLQKNKDRFKNIGYGFNKYHQGNSFGFPQSFGRVCETSFRQAKISFSPSKNETKTKPNFDRRLNRKIDLGLPLFRNVKIDKTNNKKKSKMFTKVSKTLNRKRKKKTRKSKHSKKKKRKGNNKEKSDKGKEKRKSAEEKRKVRNNKIKAFLSRINKPSKNKHSLFRSVNMKVMKKTIDKNKNSVASYLSKIGSVGETVRKTKSIYNKHKPSSKMGTLEGNKKLKSTCQKEKMNKQSRRGKNIKGVLKYRKNKLNQQNTKKKKTKPSSKRRGKMKVYKSKNLTYHKQVFIPIANSIATVRSANVLKKVEIFFKNKHFIIPTINILRQTLSNDIKSI